MVTSLVIILTSVLIHIFFFSSARNIYVHHACFNLRGSSFTPDNRFIVSLNDKPVKGHKRVEKPNKSHVQKKSTATETQPSFSPLIPREARLINQSGRRPERSESRANLSEKYIYIHIYIDEGVRPVVWQQCKHSLFDVREREGC